MRRSFIDILRCPDCHGMLDVHGEGEETIESGTLECGRCHASYPISRGIPRFVSADNYSRSFGLQWNHFRKTQLDSQSGHPITRDRFLRETGWTEADLDTTLVLDAGCGAGRFSEVANAFGARLVALDHSEAIDAARENLSHSGDIDFVQADIRMLPFAQGTFAYVFCLGVLQHTRDPGECFAALARVTASGGQLAVDIYPASWKNLFFAKYWVRPITKRMGPVALLRRARRLFPILYALSRLIGRIPLIGRQIAYAIPVSNYAGIYPLSERQLREWALLDTFDMWAPAYDKPQTRDTLRRWFQDAGFAEAEIFRGGVLIGRGRKHGKVS